MSPSGQTSGPQDPNKAQIDLWNGRVGDKWVLMKDSLDVWNLPATMELQARAGSLDGLRVLDIGCGTGATCLLWLEGGAKVTGVDVSAAMLAVAARRTGGRATLVQADASSWVGEAPFDLAVSQFGLMFFEDPDRAFAAIAANLRPGGRLLFLCWRPVAENQWVTTPMGAIRALLPPDAPSVPHAPGPFALAERERLEGILGRSGFVDVAIEPFDFPVCFAREGGVEAAVRLAMQIGPSGSALAGVSQEVLEAAAERLRVALAPHERQDQVSLGGASWLVEAVRAA
jgi:SAM-dependent methyltransferase